MNVVKTILAAGLLALAGCTKYSVECRLIVQPYVKTAPSSGDNTLAYMARAYVFYIDQNEYLNPAWQPGSWADADAGLVRHRTSGQVRSHNRMGVQSETAPYFIDITITSSPMILVVVDPVNKFYAWRKLEYQIPLEELRIPVTFKVDQTQAYKEGEWTIASETSDSNQQENGEE